VSAVSPKEGFVTLHELSIAEHAEEGFGTSDPEGSQIEPDPEPRELERFESEGGQGDTLLNAATETATPSADPIPGLTPTLWQDPDLRWLTGAHQAEGHTYILREPYEELLWWLQLPALLKLAIEPSPNREVVEQLAATVQSALSTIEAAGYRIDDRISEAKPKTKTDMSS
jgi:hypothetical protein